MHLKINNNNEAVLMLILVWCFSKTKRVPKRMLLMCRIEKQYGFED